MGRGTASESESFSSGSHKNSPFLAVFGVAAAFLPVVWRWFFRARMLHRESDTKHFFSSFLDHGLDAPSCRRDHQLSGLRPTPHIDEIINAQYHFGAQADA